MTMCRRTGSVSWLGAALIGALLLVPGSASGFEPAADEVPALKTSIHPKRVEEARAHFAEGVKRYDDGAFATAKTEFEKAYELAPSYKLLYNLGLVYGQLDDPARAIRSLEGYLAQGAWEISDERVAEVTKLVSELTPRIASAKITTNVPGTQITVDETFVGQTPMEDFVVLNPGVHKVVGKHAGRLAAEQSVTATAGEVLKVQLDLKEPPTEVPYARISVLTILLGAVVVLVLRAVRAKPSVPAAAAPAEDDASPS